MNEFQLGDVTDNFDNIRVPLSENERKKRPGKYRYFGAQEVIDYIDDYLFDGEYILVAEDGNNLISGSKPLCTLVEGKFWVNNHAHIIKANEKANTKYLNYLLNNINIRGYVTGSAQPKLNQGNLKKIKVKLPEKDVQNEIANKLYLFNKKINLNLKLIKDLEEYSQLLFHKWFVDFNFPNENGQPYKDNGGEMQVLDDKEIPVGWSKEPLENFVVRISNGDWGEEFPYEDAVKTYCIRGADIPNVKYGKIKETPLRYIRSSNNNTKKLKHGSIVIEASGGGPTQSTGRTVLLRDSFLDNVDKPLYFSNFSKVVVPKDDYSMFIYLLLNNLYKRDVFFRFEGKTSGIRNLLLNNLMKKLEFVNPSMDVLKKFEEQVGLCWDKIFNLGNENGLLVETRDLLIKKLIK